MEIEKAISNLKAYMYMEIEELPKDVGNAITEAIKALRAQLERGRGCVMCVGKGALRHAIENGYSHCPYCGRHLTESEAGE